MAEELHDVVKLLLARMETHPEEFVADLSEADSREYRWWQVIREVRESGTIEEKDAIQAGLRKIKLQRAHEIMMDELCNGDERRRKEREEQEYEANLLNSARNNMGAALNAAPHPTKKIIMTQAEMNLINKLTETSTLAEKDQFIRDYAKSKRDMQK